MSAIADGDVIFLTNEEYKNFDPEDQESSVGVSVVSIRYLEAYPDEPSSDYDEIILSNDQLDMLKNKEAKLILGVNSLYSY